MHISKVGGQSFGRSTTDQEGANMLSGKEHWQAVFPSLRFDS